MPRVTPSSNDAGDELCLRALAMQTVSGFLIGVALSVALVMSYSASLEQLLLSGHTFVACLLFAGGTGILFAVGALATFLLASKRRPFPQR